MRIGKVALGGDIDGVELGVVEWGPSEGRPVLCVHGLTRNARDFDFLATALAERGRRVISLDMVGRGKSSWLARPEDYAVPVYARHVRRFLEQRRIDEVDWVGTSMGGLIGMTVAAGEASPIRRLFLNDIGPFVPQQAIAMIALYLGRDQRFGSLEELEQHLRLIHAGFGALTDAQWRHLATHSAREDADGWRLSYDPQIKAPFLATAATDIDLWDLWPAIRCPTMVLRGAQSLLLDTATVERMQATGPRAAARTVPNVGHAPALMDAEQIGIVQDWLEG